MKTRNENDLLLELLKALYWTLRIGQHEYGDTGICKIVKEYFYKNNDNVMRTYCVPIMEAMWTEWRDYSGNKLYPVPAPYDLQNPRKAAKLYYNTNFQWFGIYGAYRRQLLFFMINTLKEATKGYQHEENTTANRKHSTTNARRKNL